MDMFFLILLHVVAGIVPVCVGMLWYSPRLFGGTWMNEVQITPLQAEVSRIWSWGVGLLSFATSMTLASAYIYLSAMLQIHTIIEALALVSILWAGLCMPVITSAFVWKEKSAQFTIVHGGYWLASLVGVALVVLLW